MHTVEYHISPGEIGYKKIFPEIFYEILYRVPDPGISYSRPGSGNTRLFTGFARIRPIHYRQISKKNGALIIYSGFRIRRKQVIIIPSAPDKLSVSSVIIQ
jgi:hypothetical protein